MITMVSLIDGNDMDVQLESVSQHDDSKKRSKIRMRCPDCGRLYEVGLAEIKSAEPHFECFHCHGIFSLNTDLIAKANSTNSTTSSARTPFKTESIRPGKVRRCPKCGEANMATALACTGCSVLFKKVGTRSLFETKQDGPRATTELALDQKWKCLMDDFDNETLHQDFLKACRESSGDGSYLEYALKRYEDLKSHLGGNPMCQKRIIELNSEISGRVSNRSSPGIFDKGLKEISNQITNQTSRLKVADTSVLKKYGSLAPYALGLIFILIGLIGGAEVRNLIGLGAAILFFNYGVIKIFQLR